MLIRVASPSDVLSSEITPDSVFAQRRRLMKSMAGVGAAAVLPAYSAASSLPSLVGGEDSSGAPAWLQRSLSGRVASRYSTNEEMTPFSDVSQYNNFYEFGFDKTDPAQLAHSLKPDPWHVKIHGEVEKPANYALEDIVSPHQLEERIYRFRCVEAWSMVVPWVGIPLASVLSKVGLTSRSRFVAFETLNDVDQMPGQKSGSIDWPYREGLRIDEAMHPLTMLVVGVYGRQLPNQNGAPLRLMVPWKYGFKSIKSIVGMRVIDHQPVTTWNTLASSEYGFYANVNPTVSHPRWSQSRERRLPTSLFSPNWMETKPFNGYESDVAGLYKGMDLRRNF